MDPVRKVPSWERTYHAKIDPHGKASALSQVVLGGQDGVVAVLGALLGVAAASAQSRLVVAAGLATAFADAVSMAAVAYTSGLAQGDVYRSEREREYRHIRQVPTLEEEEVRAIYAAKGFEGALLDKIVATIVADADVWVAVMMADEHRLEPVDRARALRSAVVVGLSTLTGALVPVAPFLFATTRIAVWLSLGSAMVSLFAIGAYKAHVTVGRPWRSGAELALIGTLSALAGWSIGALFGVRG